MATKLIAGRVRDLGGFSLRRVLPAADHRTVGPFVFFDHFGPETFGPGQNLDVRPILDWRRLPISWKEASTIATVWAFTRHYPRGHQLDDRRQGHRAFGAHSRRAAQPGKKDARHSVVGCLARGKRRG